MIKEKVLNTPEQFDKLTISEEESLQEIFRVLDVDNSGMVTRGEMFKFFKRICDDK